MACDPRAARTGGTKLLMINPWAQQRAAVTSRDQRDLNPLPRTDIAGTAFTRKQVLMLFITSG